MERFSKLHEPIRKPLLFFEGKEISVIHLVNDPGAQKILRMSIPPEIDDGNLLPNVFHNLNNCLTKAF